ncbi:MAG: hypothetical protein OXG37_11550 [Actinomycetia bacterium]|nr:hypothetical protein [Actinomycetes bacterium]
MPSTVSQIFSAAGLGVGGVLDATGAVEWGIPVPETGPGVYVVALTAETETTGGALSACPVSAAKVAGLLEACPGLTVDGSRPDVASLCDRLGAFWLPDEVVLYIGMTEGQSLRTRVSQYYTTPLGASRSHRGGWFLKTLTIRPDVYVHYAPRSNPGHAEDAMIEAFTRGVSDRSRGGLHDPGLPIPFANLEWHRRRPGKRRRKRHGIKGATIPR